MSDGNNYKGKDTIKRIAECLVQFIVVLTVVICLVGMINCFRVFNQNMRLFSTEYKNTLSVVISSLDADGSTTLISDNDSPLLSDDGEEKTEPATSTEKAKEVISNLEYMLAIQENGMTNNLMSFVYGILSTIIIGLCAKFLEQNRKNAADAEKSAVGAQENAKTAEKSAVGAQENAKAAEKSAKDAKESTETVELVRKRLDDSLRKSDEQYYLLKTLIDIIMVRIFISDGEFKGQRIVSVTDRIKELKVDIKLLSDKVSCVHQAGVFGRLREELMLLRTSIEEFKMGINENNIVAQRAVERDIDWVDEAIQICNQIAQITNES